MSIYNVGDVVTGKVTGIESYGIFLAIDDKATGLIHISQISHDYVRNIYDCAKIGDSLTAKIIEINSQNNQFKLSMKELIARSKKKHCNRIIETKSGFSNLGKALDEWVEDKFNEIMKKNEKK